MTIRNLLKKLPYLSLPLSVFNSANTLLTSKENKAKLEELQNLIQEGNNLNKTVINKLELLKADQQLPVDLNSISSTTENVRNSIDSLTNNIAEETIKQATSKFTDINSINNFYKSLLEIISKEGGNSSNTNFTIDYNIIETINNFLGNLTPLESLAIMHINASLVILLSLFSIISIFYGEFFIQKFSLETKFPKLAKFIQLRRKFQQFYLLINTLIIFAVMIAITYVDILAFVY